MGVILGVVSAIFALAAALATAANVTNSLLAQIALGLVIVGTLALVIGTVKYLLSQKTPKDELRAGQKLAVGESRRSLNGSCSLEWQEDGKLVVIRAGEDKPRWATQSPGTDEEFPKFLALQKDGNLVLYALNGTRLWATETDGQGGTRLVMQDDGNLVLRTDGGRAIWSSDKPELRAGEDLTTGQALRSSGECFRLDLQEGGKLVVIRKKDGKRVWQTDTDGTGANRLLVQKDGDLVLYRPDGEPVWATETDGQGGTWLVMQGDGNLVLRTAGGRAVWASVKRELRAGEKLTVGQALRSPGSPDERFRLDLQQDGNLAVIRTDGCEAIWQSGTAEKGVKYLTMQKDGNLVLYALDGTPVWATQTDGKGGTRVVIQGDGNLVLRTDEGKSIWQSNAGPA